MWDLTARITSMATRRQSSIMVHMATSYPFRVLGAKYSTTSPIGPCQITKRCKLRCQTSGKSAFSSSVARMSKLATTTIGTTSPSATRAVTAKLSSGRTEPASNGPWLQTTQETVSWTSTLEWTVHTTRTTSPRPPWNTPLKANWSSSPVLGAKNILKLSVSLLENKDIRKLFNN